MGAQNFRSIEPLVESEPLGLIWSVNEITDSGNHKKIQNNFNKNPFLKNGIFISHEILSINKFKIIVMVPEILNFIDRPN